VRPPVLVGLAISPSENFSSGFSGMSLENDMFRYDSNSGSKTQSSVGSCLVNASQEQTAIEGDI